MEVTQSTGKQLLIQLAINVVASAIVSYIMYKLLQPKDDASSAIAKQVSTTPTVTATTAPAAV